MARQPRRIPEQEETNPEGTARGPRAGRLAPRADPVTGTLGWQALTVSRTAAVAVAAITGGTVVPLGKGEWQARIPEPALEITLAGAGPGTLWCHLGSNPESGVFTLAFPPWQAEIVLASPVTGFPAHGKLSVRDVRLATRMGRTVRFLVPEFTPV